ncbi:MAG: glycosyltransferase [Acidobacteriota bacterium]
MRVLWLTTTPGLGVRHLGASFGVGGGWIASLERVIKEAGNAEARPIHLDLAFPWEVPKVQRIPDGDHNYYAYPRYPQGSRLRRMAFDLSCRLVPEGEVRHLTEIVERSRPDLIHVWGTEFQFGRVAQHTDRPILIEIQGIRTPYTEIYCSAFSRWEMLRYGSARRLLQGRSLLQNFYRYRRSARREREILRTARHVNGRTLWDRHVTRALAPAARYHHCDRVLRPPFYRDPAKSKSAAAPSEEGVLRLVSTLRGNAYKGVEVLARCAELLQELIPQGFVWTLVGIRSGEEIHRMVERKWKLSFDRLGIRLTGRQDAEAVAEHLAQSDLYVLPSRIENSANGLAEAMITGLPIVATASGGTPSMLADGREGLLIPAGDPWAMAGAIGRLAEDRRLRQELGRQARRTALVRHDPAAIASKLRNIYADILSDHRAGNSSRQEAAR